MSLAHWAIVALVVFLLFGAGKLPRLMEDVAEGIKAFKRGMRDDDDSQKQLKDQSTKKDEV